MYRSTKYTHDVQKKWEFPINFDLDENNRWLILAKLIPWAEFEQEYAGIFHQKIGSPAKSFQMALGALIIQQISVLRQKDVKN